jgi:hypothetical protein
MIALDLPPLWTPPAIVRPRAVTPFRFYVNDGKEHDCGPCLPADLAAMPAVLRALVPAGEVRPWLPEPYRRLGDDLIRVLIASVGGLPGVLMAGGIHTAWLSDNAVITAPIADGARVDLPGIGCMSPAVAGWQGGGVLSYEGEAAVEGAAQFALLPVEDFVVPDGKQISGAASYGRDGDAVTETFPVEDIPAPVELTPEQKLGASGLTVADLKTLLGLP